MSELLTGPIADRHRDLGADFAPFGGWEMPVAYAGTVAEHQAVRETVGLFDVSHLGKALVAGPGAAEFIDATLTNDLSRIGPGQAQYTLCCNGSGGVIDDLLVYLVSDEEVFLVPNAANTGAVVAALSAVAPEGVTVSDQHLDYAVFAVQGSRSPDVLAAVGLPADMGYMSFVDAELVTAGGRYPVRVCRSGYTGERGYEVLPRWADAGPVFDELLAAVTASDGRPAGLGARDTLRTEMGYALHGHEFSEDVSPLQARSGWAVGWDKPAFFGREALLAERAAGPQWRLYGLTAVGRGVPRAGCDVLDSSGGTVIGTCTSGTFSPTLKTGIALARCRADAAPAAGDRLIVDVRGRPLECEVTAPPFVPSHV